MTNSVAFFFPFQEIKPRQHISRQCRQNIKTYLVSLFLKLGVNLKMSTASFFSGVLNTGAHYY